ncbi:MAG: DUF6429 family protein [Chloroflexi bacterium]|nr:DUF6429 family protein [Chloroflexota bacterium]
MEYDEDKVDEIALALLYLSLGEPPGGNNYAWKGMAWEVSDRLYERGWIENPRNENKSFTLTMAGREACIRLFKEYFWKPTTPDDQIEGTPTLFPLPINMEVLTWLYQYPEDEPSIWWRYLDTATGIILNDQYDEETGMMQPHPDLSSDPRYLFIPAQSVAEYLDDVRQYTRSLKQGELKMTLTTLLEDQEITAETLLEIRSLLQHHEKWKKWQYKRNKQRLLPWLASYDIKPKWD